MYRIMAEQLETWLKLCLHYCTTYMENVDVKIMTPKFYICIVYEIILNIENHSIGVLSRNLIQHLKHTIIIIIQ